ncbi:hypothetical protein [Cohnella yongneupensis]|uniref:Uncharacterized protein n=1 Tax=Cohnella yongneupensis TaxID=425006 RepID=A0ABW0QU15_9BACL
MSVLNGGMSLREMYPILNQKIQELEDLIASISGGGGGGSGDMLKSVYDTNGNGVVDQAAKLQTARTITLTGSVSGSTSFDGSSDATINVTGGGGGGVTVGTSLPTAAVGLRGNLYLLQGVSGVAEVASLAVSAGCTTNGNVTVTLDGNSFDVALTTASQGTAANVATKIRGTTFAGWTTGGSGTTVTFTCNTTGNKVNATYSAGSTGASGTMTTPTQGVLETADSLYICIRLASGSYDWASIPLGL